MHVQEHELSRINRNKERKGEPPLEPDFGGEYIENVMKLLTLIPYNSQVEIAPDIKARVKEAGHLLGSASIELTAHEDDKNKIILFSGDLGRQNMAIINDPDPFHHADLVFMESTYGDPDQKSLDLTLVEAKNIILKAVENKGKILVPSFAVGVGVELALGVAQTVKIESQHHEPGIAQAPRHLDVKTMRRYPALDAG